MGSQQFPGIALGSETTFGQVEAATESAVRPRRVIVGNRVLKAVGQNRRQLTFRSSNSIGALGQCSGLC